MVEQVRVLVDPPSFSTRRAESYGRRALRGVDLARRERRDLVDGGPPGGTRDTVLDAGAPGTVFGVADVYEAGVL